MQKLRNPNDWFSLIMGVKCAHLHNRAGVAAFFAAFSNEKDSVWLSDEQLLCLHPVQIPHEPALLIIVRQVLFLLAHKGAPAQRHRRLWATTCWWKRRSVHEQVWEDSLISVLVLQAKPVVDSFLPYSFVIEPAGEGEEVNVRTSSRNLFKSSSFI